MLSCNFFYHIIINGTGSNLTITELGQAYFHPTQPLYSGCILATWKNGGIPSCCGYWCTVACSWIYNGYFCEVKLPLWPVPEKLWMHLRELVRGYDLPANHELCWAMCWVASFRLCAHVAFCKLDKHTRDGRKIRFEKWKELSRPPAAKSTTQLN